MRRAARRARSAAIAILLSATAGGMAFAQNEPPADRGAPSPVPANAPEQVRRAQVELKRLDCLAGRVDGKLGNQTREAVKKFWASAKKPAIEVVITDELIAELAERGDNFCRPPRRFFSTGGRPGALPFFAPGGRPAAVPPAQLPVPPDEH